MSRSVRLGPAVLGLVVAGAIPHAAAGQSTGRVEAGYPAEYCLERSSGLSIDHVVVAVSHLPTAEADFRDLGFRLKPGRRHENGLRNSHIKFRDGSAIELMTIEGRAADPVAGRYEAFLASGEGAAFVAIEADLEIVTAAAEAVGMDWQTSSAGPYSWVTLADSTPVFFIQWSRRPLDPDRLTAQVDEVTGISSVRLTATAEFERLLSGLGVVRCPASAEPDILDPVARPTLPVRTLRLEDRLDTRFEVREVSLHGGQCTVARRLDPTRTHGVDITLDGPRSRRPEVALDAGPGPDGGACVGLRRQ